MRTFVLNRRRDDTGISGTGIVAEGIQFSDGTVVLRWLGPVQHPWGTTHPTTVVHPHIDNVFALHGHNGDTQVVWGGTAPDPPRRAPTVSQAPPDTVAHPGQVDLP